MTATINAFQIIVQVVISMYKQVSRYLQMEGFFFSFLPNTAFTEEKSQSVSYLFHWQDCRGTLNLGYLVPPQLQMK